MYNIVLPNQLRRILLASNCIVMPCSVPVNCPAVICLPFMPCCLSKESTSSELWTLVQPLPLIHLPLLLLYLLQTITFHTICLILYYSKPVSLTTSLFVGTKSWVCVVQVSTLLCNTFETFPSSFWFDNLGLYWGKTCWCAHHTFLLGFPMQCAKHSQQDFLAPLPGRLRTASQVESFTSFLFTLFLFCLVYFALFCLPLFIKN